MAWYANGAIDIGTLSGAVGLKSPLLPDPSWPSLSPSFIFLIHHDAINVLKSHQWILMVEASIVTMIGIP